MSRRTKKIIIGIAAGCVIIVILLTVNSITGNPVSNHLAVKSAQSYIDTNYGDLNLKIQKSGYNFKFGSYLVFVQSDTSEDTAFGIYADSFGSIIHDDYEYEVANNFTTFRRMDMELREIAADKIGTRLNYDLEGVYLSFVKEADFMELQRDMKLDVSSPPLPLWIDVAIYDKDVSYEKIAEVAKAVELILREQNIPVREYSICILPSSDKPEDEAEAAPWANSLSVSYYPSERMNEENLAQAMEAFETGRVNEENKENKK